MCYIFLNKNSLPSQDVFHVPFYFTSDTQVRVNRSLLQSEKIVKIPKGRFYL